MKSLATMICLLLLPQSVSAGDFAIRRFPADADRGSSRAVSIRNADLIYSTQLLPGVSSGVDLESQQQSLCARTEQLLRLLGLTPGNVIKLNLYVADDRDAAALIPVLAARFGTDQLPAVSWVTTTLPDPQARLALDFVAARDPSAKGNSLPQPEDGVSSLAMIPASATSRVFISGQAEKGDGTVTDATRQTMASLFRTLTFLELQPADVVQVKAFLTPMSQSADALAAIRAAFAPAACPPVVFVAWQSPSLPVEIELVAATSKPLAAKRPVVEFLTPPDMKASPVYCRVARVQSPTTIFLSGLYGTQPDPDSEAELRELFGQTKSLAEGAGSDLKHLVKATYYVSSPGSSQQHNTLRPEYYDPERPPAASKAIVQGVGRPGRTITWDMIAVPKDE